MLYSFHVLIETYWNVKNGGSRNKQEAVKCINRNILECKGGTTWNYTYETKVLIETYWNVKGEISEDSDEPHIVLIETYWNVKTYKLTYYSTLFFGINRNILECKGAFRWWFRRSIMVS